MFNQLILTDEALMGADAFVKVLERERRGGREREKRERERERERREESR